ncbi:MAG: hypothetical protein VKJ64_06480 [Leptolyngbyaceae bacterium]|nr:hypothetical protein [Leptolyngbyaceae bacterium]
MSQYKSYPPTQPSRSPDRSPLLSEGLSASGRSLRAESGGRIGETQDLEAGQADPKAGHLSMGPGAEYDVASHAINQDIQAITHYLRHESPLLDLVAIDLYQHLIEQYGAELDQEMTSDTILTTLKNWAREQCDRHNHWVQTAEGISASLVAKAIQAMERDLGHSMLESLDWNEFNQILFQYLFEHPATPIKQRLEPLETHYAQLLSQQIVSELDLDHQSISSLKRNLGLAPHISHTLPLLGQTLAHIGPIPEIASEMPLIVGEDWDGDLLFSDQFQADLWASDAREIAYLRYHSKQRRHQYLEHYLTSEADIDSLPWDGVAQILTKFGLTAAKLHLLLLAYSAQHTDWYHPFTVTVAQLVTDLGWQVCPIHPSDAAVHHQGVIGKRGMTPSRPTVSTAQTKVTNVLYALSCILVKLVWVEHGDRAIIGQTPVGKLWDMVITPTGEFDWQTGQIEAAQQINITVRPGLWIDGLRHPLSHPSPHPGIPAPGVTGLDTNPWLSEHPHTSHVQQQLWHCGELAHQLLRLGAYAQDLAMRMIVHLMLNTQTQTNDSTARHYLVESLLAQVVPPAKLAKAKTNIKHGQQLFEAWNDMLTVLAQLQWYPDPNYASVAHAESRLPLAQGEHRRASSQPITSEPDLTQFYVYPYPKWLAPHSTMRKPRGWVQTWLEQTVQIRSDIHTMEYF